jgi:hypothetical protein
MEVKKEMTKAATGGNHHCASILPPWVFEQDSKIAPIMPAHA